MEERRLFPRSRTYLGGQIAYNARSAIKDCIVRNMSQNGARLAVDSNAAIPCEFDLMVRKKDQNRRARIVWRGEREIGVVFGGVDARIDSIETARRIDKLEAERDILARRVSQLSEAM